MFKVQGNINFCTRDDGTATAKVRVQNCPYCHHKHSLSRITGKVQPGFTDREILVNAPCGAQLLVGLYEEALLAREQLQEQLSAHLIYFVLAPIVQLIRVGASSDGPARLADHHVEQAVHVEVYGLLQNLPTREVAFELEGQLHRLFKPALDHGSWYHFEMIKSGIDELLNDPSSLSPYSDWGKAIHVTK